jgi:hypothetical protein
MKKPEYDQEQFRKDITKVINKHFTDEERDIDQVLELFKLGQQVKLNIKEEAEDRISFDQALQNLISKYSIENGSDTPDFLLRDYLISCLDNFDNITIRRNKHYGRKR